MLTNKHGYKQSNKQTNKQTSLQTHAIKTNTSSDVASEEITRTIRFSELLNSIKQNQNYHLTLDFSTSITGLHQKKLVLSSSVQMNLFNKI